MGTCILILRWSIIILGSVWLGTTNWGWSVFLHNSNRGCKKLTASSEAAKSSPIQHTGGYCIWDTRGAKESKEGNLGRQEQINYRTSKYWRATFIGKTDTTEVLPRFYWSKGSGVSEVLSKVLRAALLAIVLLEPSCCKKRQKKSQPRNWFGK